MRDWLIRKLGGVPREEHEALRERWDVAVATMLKYDRVAMFVGPLSLSGATIDGPLIVAPGGNVAFFSSYIEGPIRDLTSSSLRSAEIAPATKH